MSDTPGLQHCLAIDTVDYDQDISRLNYSTPAELSGARLCMVRRIGSFQDSLPYAKDVLDYWLSRFPRVYLFLDRYREWQNWDRRVYLSLVQPGDTVLDIGANVGAHTVMFSHLVGKEGKVVSFEPVPSNFEKLKETVRSRSRFSNVTALQLAVGSPSVPMEKALITVPGGDFTQASLIPHRAGSWSETTNMTSYVCTITSLDAELAVNPVERLDFIKMDVEGGELSALGGAARTLSKHRPLLYCEVYERWAASFGYTSTELVSFVRSVGYSDARVIREGVVHPIRLADPVPPGLFDVSSDVLFFAAEHSKRIDRFDRRYHVRKLPQG